MTIRRWRCVSPESDAAAAAATHQISSCVVLAVFFFDEALRYRVLVHPGSTLVCPNKPRCYYNSYLQL